MKYLKFIRTNELYLKSDAGEMIPHKEMILLLSRFAYKAWEGGEISKFEELDTVHFVMDKPGIEKMILFLQGIKKDMEEIINQPEP